MRRRKQRVSIPVQQKSTRIGGWMKNAAYNVIESIDQEKHREIKKSMRFKTRTDKEKSNRLSTGSLTTRTTTTTTTTTKRKSEQHQQ